MVSLFDMKEIAMMRRNERPNGRFFGLFLVPISLALLAVIALRPVLPAENVSQPKSPAATPKTYLLVCPDKPDVLKLPVTDLHWKELLRLLDEKSQQLIQVVERSAIKESLYIDTEGLRLHVASPQCLITLKEPPAESQDRITLPYLVRNLLLRRYSETGIEPDRIPVLGVAGKQPGAKDMVFIKSGEYAD